MARKGASKKIKIIIMPFIKIETGTKEKTRFLLFFVFSATSFEMAIGRPKEAMVINKEKVGRIII